MKRQLGESTKITHKASRTDPAGPTSLQLCKKPKIETAVSIDTPSRAHTNPTFSPGAPIQASAGSSSRLKRKAEQSRAEQKVLDTYVTQLPAPIRTIERSQMQCATGTSVDPRLRQVSSCTNCHGGYQRRPEWPNSGGREDRQKRQRERRGGAGVGE